MEDIPQYAHCMAVYYKNSAAVSTNMRLDFVQTAEATSSVVWRTYTAVPHEERDVVALGNVPGAPSVTVDTPSAAVDFDFFMLYPDGRHEAIPKGLVTVDVQTDRGMYRLGHANHAWTLPQHAMVSGTPLRLTLWVRVGEIKTKSAVRVRALVGGSLVLWSQPFLTLSKNNATRAHWAHVVARPLLRDGDARWKDWSVCDQHKSNTGPFRSVLHAVTTQNHALMVPPPRLAAFGTTTVVHVGEYRRRLGVHGLVSTPPWAVLAMVGEKRKREDGTETKPEADANAEGEAKATLQLQVQLSVRRIEQLTAERDSFKAECYKLNAQLKMAQQRLQGYDVAMRIKATS